MLCNRHKDVVSGKILFFANIFGFPGVNWAQKWTKTVNFEYVPFPLKRLILKYCSETVFVLWETTSGRNFRKLEPCLGEKGPRKPPKRRHFMDASSPRKHLKSYNLTTKNAILMKLSTIMYHHKMFNSAEDFGCNS